MLDLRQLRQIMRQSLEKKVFIADEEDTYVVLTYDEYQHLLESHDFVATVRKSPETGSSEHKIADYEDNHQSGQYERMLSVSEPIQSDALAQVNEEINRLHEQMPDPGEIRYEQVGNGYTEEPI